ncbi:MAG: EAL domain-containing protein [Rubrivivax sp.]|nr:EAL domain-containing protein [Rubrivivax sp.]
MTAREPPDELRALRAEVVQFRQLCNNVPVAIAYYERNGTICRYANHGYAAMFGHDEESVLGRTVTEIIGEEAARVIQPEVDRVISERVSVGYERRLPGGSGGVRSIEVHLLPHLGLTDEAIGAFVLISDITRHRRAEAALRESEERLAKFMHASAEGIVFHKGGFITDANPPLLALVGYPLDQLLGRSTLDFVAPPERARVAEVIAAGDELAYDSALLHADGSTVPVEFIVRTMYHQGERLRMTIVRDRRDRVAAEARIQYLAHHDVLTGLPNRAAFIERATLLLNRAAERGQALALLFIDLDHFKRVNDSLGHPAGDTLLQTVAERIVGTLREADLVARFGGDEFVLLLAGTTSAAAVAEVAGKLLATIGAPLAVAQAAISVTPSIGVAMFPDHGDCAAELIKHADTAMYQAKARGRAGYQFFHPAMAELARAELAMESRLAQAVREQEFVLHYQPQLRLADGALIGVEALVRWNHPQDGFIGPDHFIPVAEARRLILPIGQWVLGTALRQAVSWHASGLAAVPMAVNLSALQFQAPGFVDSIERALQEAGASGTMLELELTERMLMDNLDEVRAVLARLRALGVRIAIDDFGTGYTSLKHLKSLPLDRLKIDRSFVEDLPHDAGSAAIANAIIQMGRGLKLQVVAEGVETEAQRAHLLAQGCDAQQGLLDCGPLPADAFEAWQSSRARAGA